MCCVKYKVFCGEWYRPVKGLVPVFKAQVLGFSDKHSKDTILRPFEKSCSNGALVARITRKQWAILDRVVKLDCFSFR